MYARINWRSDVLSRENSMSTEERNQRESQRGLFLLSSLVFTPKISGFYRACGAKAPDCPVSSNDIWQGWGFEHGCREEVFKEVANKLKLHNQITRGARI